MAPVDKVSGEINFDEPPSPETCTYRYLCE